MDTSKYLEIREKLIKYELDRYYNNKDEINTKNKLRYYKKKFKNDTDAMLILDDTNLCIFDKLDKIKEYNTRLKKQEKFKKEKDKLSLKIIKKFNGDVDKLKQKVLINS